MPIKILMPALSPTMTMGNLAKWLKKEGDKIKPGEVIAEIETDKATMEVEAVDEGVLAKILIASSTEDVAVGSLIAVLLEEGEDQGGLEAFIASNSVVVAKVEAVMTEAPKVATAAPVMAQGSSSRVKASPLAKRLAEQNNVNLGFVQGSGPGGRIVKTDILQYNSGPQTRIGRHAEEYSLKPHNNMRKVIAKRLVESKQTIPHFYLNIECQLDKLLEVRAELNDMAGAKPAYKISVNDMIIKAVALALRDVPEANGSWADGGIMYYNNIDIAVAVAIDDGLITPLIKNAEQKAIKDISIEMKELAARAKENKLRPEEFQGGGFSISNLGMYGIKRFNAIVNPPQSCILAVGAGDKRVIVENEQMRIANVMDVTLSCDHRVVDGAVAARFLTAFKMYIERPIRML